MSEIKYKRILLKLSGEALAGENKTGISPDVLNDITSQIKDLRDLGVEVAIVVGGGNFWRGKYGHTMERTTSDYMGMLATTINALALQDALEAKGMFTRVQTAIEMREIAEPYIKRKATKHLEKGRIVIFGCGTGSPFFSTDTASALRAAEINADILIKGTKVDGVYDKDPLKYKDAKKYDEISYIDVLNQKLNVMDSTATSLCMEENIPILVVNINEKNIMLDAINNPKIGTLVK